MQQHRNDENRNLHSAHVERVQAGMSAVEYEPAELVSQPLIVQDEIADRIRKLLALPLTLPAACLVPFTLSGGCPCSPDGIGGCAQLMCRNMRHGCSLSRSKSRLPGSSAQDSGGCHGMTGGRSGLCHRDFTANPGPELSDRLPGSRV
jgi:hypothetical protein